MDYSDSDMQVIADADFERTKRVQPDRTVFIGRFTLSPYPEKISSPVVKDAKASSLLGCTRFCRSHPFVRD
jgi:hypothetical protein